MEKKEVKKVAIVYDWVNQWGGAERVLKMLEKIYPQAHLYTGVFAPQKAKWAKSFSKISFSFLNYFPGAKTKYYYYFPLFPLAFEGFDFSEYQLVVTVTTFPAKFIITPPEVFHLCYCLTPPRFLWERESLGKKKWLFPLLFPWRTADFLGGQRPDYFLTTCHHVARRIEKYYRRPADVVYPGIDTKFFSPSPRVKKGDFYLVVSRLVEYKRVDLVIEVFNHLGWPLRIIGEGREEKRLKKMAKGNIQFLGRVDDEELRENYRQALAVICPQKEDFGLVPLEAQACGTPVIALKAGGHLETVVPGKTGMLFPLQTKESLLKLVGEFNPHDFNPESCRKQAEKFSQERFLQDFSQKVQKAMRSYYQQFRKEKK